MVGQLIGKYRMLFVFILVALCGAAGLWGFRTTAKAPARAKSSTTQQFPTGLPNAYRQTNLVSDIPGVGQFLDPSLVNPWGVAESATSPFWVSNEATGTATLYGGDVGTAPLTKNTLTVAVKNGGGNTGVVFNGSSSFVITDGSGTGPARFIFSTVKGTINAWRAGTAAVEKVNDPTAAYTGLAIGNDPTFTWIFGANFKAGRIDTYGTNFTIVHFGNGDFVDPTIPTGYAPFNVQNLGGKIYVAYALVGPTGEDQPGPGNGFVDVFSVTGQFLQRLISNGVLNSPWGMTIAPATFGAFANTLLVGNFGDGRINAFDPNTGVFLGTLDDQAGNPLEIEGLWAISFGNGVGGGGLNTLYFNAGIGDETHGIFGSIVPAAPAASLIALSSATYTASETAGFVDITVNRSGDISQSATVKFSAFSKAGAADASPVSDFIPTTGTLNFTGGQASQTFRVLVIDDTFVEGNAEDFHVMLSNPTSAALTVPNTAEVTITDNDGVGAPSPAPATFVGSLNGAQEVPARVSNGTGTGIVKVTNEATGAATVSLAFTGLTSAAILAHIHGPAAPGVNAPILFPLPIPTGGTSGQVNDFAITMTPTQVQQLKDGLFYFNVHSSNFPGGEIRAQILSNPIDETSYFVREQYYDFLNRQPDPGGLAFWINNIDSCGVNTNCISSRRIDASTQFFVTTEFQVTEFYVYRVRKASFGVLPTFSQFTLDRSQIGSGTATDKRTFTEGFVQTGDFLGFYPTTQSGAAFIDKLVATVLAGSGIDLTARKPDLQNEYLLELTQTASRARVIRRLVDYPEFITAEFNRAFVATQYYGYLRRDPDPAGFSFWLGVLNSASTNSRSMVCSFLTSAEYQLRFGPMVTRNNAECATVAP